MLLRYGHNCAKALSSIAKPGTRRPEDFCVYPDFLSLTEQRVLLAASLRLLDTRESRRYRRRREARQLVVANDPNLQDSFYPDDYYFFEKGHYDGVIRHFREMHVTAWPGNIPELSPILTHLYSLCPGKDIQTHVLHLSSQGEILPHIDNVGASGSWIMGVSLGADRIMRMTSRIEGETDEFDILLTTGSVYIQRNTVRYNYTHSILKAGIYDGVKIQGGQRLSIMFRDRVNTQACSV